MDILTESGLIKGNVKKNVELLARIRNRYAHKLAPNEQRITNYIRELHYLGSTPKLGGKYAKYRVCVIRTFLVLEKMLESPGKVFSRDNIGKIINISKERTIDVMITRLRQKIESNPKNPKYLQTIRGSGYVLWIE